MDNIAKRTFFSISSAIFAIGLAVSIPFYMSKAHAFQIFPGITDNPLFTIIPINTASDDLCEFIGYTEIELRVNTSSINSSTMTIYAMRPAPDKNKYKVAVLTLKDGIYRYPVEFFASDCTKNLMVEFSN